MVLNPVFTRLAHFYKELPNVREVYYGWAQQVVWNCDEYPDEVRFARMKRWLIIRHFHLMRRLWIA